MTEPEEHKHLAWFLGPKAENGEIMEDLLLQILRDYFHWRKNYFPGDPILVTRSLQREFGAEHDWLKEHLDELMAALRRNFPFYSPRYMGHMLSDTLMPSALGFMAGLMFNPNNVTPEAAPVTTELELDACSAVLAMLGYEPPPEPPRPDEDARTYYERAGRKEFGWAHITSGGTVANIEALWIARQARYFPLSLREVARSLGLEITVTLPDGSRSDIREVDPYRLLLIKPREAIYLLPKYIRALRRHEKPAHRSGDPLWKTAWRHLHEAEYSLAGGTGRCFGEFPPAILVAGSRHYSIAKAADIIGIGQRNIVSVRTDASFRIDVEDLRRKLLQVLHKRCVPLCVVATAGTTEEGAVDPVHRIVKLRSELEASHQTSFWLHVDAAWGGFIRTLFSVDWPDRAVALALKIGKHLQVPYRGDLPEWHERFSSRVDELIESSTKVAVRQPSKPDRAATSESEFRKNTRNELDRMREHLESRDYRQYIAMLERFPQRFRHRVTEPKIENFRLTPHDITHWVREYVQEEIEISAGKTGKRFRLNWPSPEVGSAFVAFSEADSVTVDPHKMGYGPYPSGCIAFRNDRVRLFVLQRAPYVTAGVVDPLLHTPPRHRQIDCSGGAGGKVVIDSFSPFILEGSKPGAAAAALWLSVQTAPLTARGHGLIVRQSILAARELYEWLTRWDWLMSCEKQDLDYRFVSLTPDQPDTNVVTFVVEKKSSESLSDLNRLTELVYERFTILSELGEREYSYNQSFFLSHTRMENTEYPAESLESFFERCGLSASARTEYLREGLVVLRACVMNPYINASRKIRGQDFARALVEELDRAAREHVRNVS